jgi:proliferating cell nuclear antigen PCNA
MSESNQIFYCKTTEGYIIKVLSELLQNNIKNGCFIVSEKGMFFRMTDSNRRILIDVKLSSDKFSSFKYNQSKDKQLSIGLNLSHFYKMLKNIKKKDSLALFIEENKEDVLGIRVIPKEKNRITTSFVKIQNLQSLDIDIPESYNKPVNIPSNEYIKMIKDLNNMGGSMITISSCIGFLKFNCDTSGIYSREIIFGDSDEKMELSCVQEFDVEQLYRVSKITGICSLIQIYQKDGLPLLFSGTVGNLGTISIFVKDKKQIQEEDLCKNDDSE